MGTKSVKHGQTDLIHSTLLTILVNDAAGFHDRHGKYPHKQETGAARGAKGPQTMRSRTHNACERVLDEASSIVPHQKQVSVGGNEKTRSN